MATIISLSAYRQGHRMNPANAADVFKRQSAAQQACSLAAVAYLLDKALTTDPQTMQQSAGQQQALFSAIFDALPTVYQRTACNVINRVTTDPAEADRRQMK